MDTDPSSTAPPSQWSWRRNLAILFMVQFLSAAGFSLVFPFLPLYVKELGSVSGGSVEFWSSMVFSAQAFTMMLAAPIWGLVADRYGRKLMLERATLGGAVLLAAMGFVQNAEQLVLLRAIQGAVTGVIAATFTLVAVGTPRSHVGFALGMINMARWAGVAGGPVIGGLIGEHVGFRQSFWITGFLLGLAGLAVLFFVHEDFSPPEELRQPRFWSSYRELLRAPAMAGLYGLAFFDNLGRTLISPILVLFVVALQGGQETGSATLTGIMFGVMAGSSAISAIYWGRLGDRLGHDRILVISAALAALLYLPQSMVTSAWQLIILQALSGMAVGGLVPSVAALMNEWAPDGHQGVTYGLDNSVRAGARSVGPLIAASVALWVGYRGVFVGTALVYAAMAMLGAVLRRRRQAIVFNSPGYG